MRSAAAAIAAPAHRASTTVAARLTGETMGVSDYTCPPRSRPASLRQEPPDSLEERLRRLRFRRRRRARRAMELELGAPVAHRRRDAVDARGVAEDDAP